MTKTTAIALQIVPGDARPTFRQIVDGVRKEIATGNLAYGCKLPSVRALAIQLTINANTVAKAYTELTNQGLIESRKGLGVFVAEPKQLLSQQEQDRRLQDACQRFINDVMYLDHKPEEIAQLVLSELNDIKK